MATNSICASIVICAGKTRGISTSAPGCNLALSERNQNRGIRKPPATFGVHRNRRPGRNSRYQESVGCSPDLRSPAALLCFAQACSHPELFCPCRQASDNINIVRRRSAFPVSVNPFGDAIRVHTRKITHGSTALLHEHIPSAAAAARGRYLRPWRIAPGSRNRLLILCYHGFSLDGKLVGLASHPASCCSRKGSKVWRRPTCSRSVKVCSGWLGEPCPIKASSLRSTTACTISTRAAGRYWLSMICPLVAV